MKRALLVIAHPDDECMFFAPTIQCLRRKGYTLSLVCLSTGNSAGLGHVRVEELKRSCQILGIQSVHALDEFKDGMKEQWNEEKIKAVIRKYCNGINVIYTFDRYGVSGHPNHCAIARALENLPNVYCLKSFPLILKYLGPIGALFISLFYSSCFHLSVSAAIRSGRAAMYEHRSQMIWFRHLFVLFSIHMYINVYEKRK